MPFGPHRGITALSVEGVPRTKSEQESYPVNLRSVSTKYFLTIGTRLLRGRAFDEHDTRLSVAVAIVNEELSRHFWPGKDPIGRRISRSLEPKEGEWLTVVGVVEGTRYPQGQWRSEAELYLPFAQDASTSRMAAMVVRTSGDPG